MRFWSVNPNMTERIPAVEFHWKTTSSPIFLTKGPYDWKMGCREYIYYICDSTHDYIAVVSIATDKTILCCVISIWCMQLNWELNDDTEVNCSSFFQQKTSNWIQLKNSLSSSLVLLSVIRKLKLTIDIFLLAAYSWHTIRTACYYLLTGLILIAHYSDIFCLYVLTYITKEKQEGTDKNRTVHLPINWKNA